MLTAFQPNAFQKSAYQIVSSSTGGWETESSQKRSNRYPQANPVEVVNSVRFTGSYGWEQSQQPLHRVAFASSTSFEFWPEEIVVEGAWGFEQALPRLWKPVPTQAGLVETWPVVLIGRYGWEQSLSPLHRVAFASSASFEFWPEEIVVEGTWGFEQALSRSWKPVPTQAGLVETWPLVLSGCYGWEQAQSTLHRSVFASSALFEACPEEIIVEGTWGFEQAQPHLWKPVPVQAGFVETWPGALTGRYGWEQSMSAFFRASVQSPASFEVKSLGANEVVWGFETALSPQLRFLYTSPQSSDLIPSTIAVWGWELPTPSPARPPVDTFCLIEVFPSVIQSRLVDSVDVNRRWQASRHDVFSDAQATLIQESFYGWDNSLPVARSVFHPAPNEEVFGLSVNQVEPWVQELPLDLFVKFKHTRPTILDVFPSQPVVPLSPWGFDLSMLQARAGRKIITFDDWWPLIVQPNLLLPGGYKPSSIFEHRDEDRDFINRIEQTIEAIDEELLALTEEQDDESSGFKVAEPDILPPGWRSGKDNAQPKVEAERVRHVHYNFASDLDFGVRRRIVGILDRAEHRGLDIYGSDAFVTKETARVHGQLVVQGTNAWILKVGGDARLELAREALVEGFKLVSFDDTSLSFIHRPTYPWKQIYMGAGLGAAIMGAGVGLGYLIWGRAGAVVTLPAPQLSKIIKAVKSAQKTSAPKSLKPKSTKK